MQSAARLGEDRLLLLLDNVWPSSLGVVQQLVDALPDGSTVVDDSESRGAVQLQAQDEAVVLQQVPMPGLRALLRAHCPGVEVSGATGEELAKACGQHPLALQAVGTQLSIMCGEQAAAGATPEHVLASLTSAQDSELLQRQNVYHSVGWEDFDLTVASCLDWSYRSLASERLKIAARTLSMFPVERVIPLGALQRALGHADDSTTRVAVASLTSSSIVVSCENDEVEVHRLFHEVLAARRHEAVEEATAGTAQEHEKRVAAATAYFEAYHLVRTDGGWDALGRATEGCEELRDDECIVVTAVRQNGACFNFASERLKGEDRVLREAIEQLPNVGDAVQFGKEAANRVGAMLQEDVERFELVLGGGRVLTELSLADLAMLLHEQGKLGEAEPLYRRALEGRQAKLGADHPDTLSSLFNLALLLAQQGKLGEAEQLYRRALEGRQAKLGADHPDTLTSLNNVANLLMEQGKHADAGNLFPRRPFSGPRRLGQPCGYVLYSCCLQEIPRNQQSNQQSRCTIM